MGQKEKRQVAVTELNKELKIALTEIGEIKPWFDRKVKAWVFEHPLYPVYYAGDSRKQALKEYPKYLRQFLAERLKENLEPLVEKKTTGRGGKRVGAGRPQGTAKEPKSRIYLPIDIAGWLKLPINQERVRRMMHR